jgi:cation:H+ antiporter
LFNCDLLNLIVSQIQHAGLATPWFYAGMFMAASLLMIWRLEAMSSKGFEGTVLGTLVMPYCSGLGNLIFAFLLARTAGSGAEVMTNCLVNNVTNLTLILGLPAVMWGINIVPTPKDGKKKPGKTDSKPQLNRLSLMLTLIAALFFTGVTWALSRDGKLDFSDGLVLVGIFLFWQCVHVFEVLKNNVRQNKKISPTLFIDLVILGLGAYFIYVSIDWLVTWLSTVKAGFISSKQLGWLSGWLMVLPNALLALYYGWKRRAEVIYSSQVGDGHICIPLCLGIFALFQPITIPAFFQTGALVLGGAAAIHFLFVAILGGLPRLIGLGLISAYGFFVYKGLIG